MNYTEAVYIIRQALDISLLPIVGQSNRCEADFVVNRNHYQLNFHSHSTAVRLEIFAKLGEEKLLVFYKTNWFSSRYEFNEKDKIIGYQCDGPWKKDLSEWFIELKTKVDEYYTEKCEVAVSEAELAKQAEEEKIKRFTKHFNHE